MIDNKDRIIARIRKMLALANDASASEGERDNALRMAHATLAKYNLDLSGIEAAGQPQQEKREFVKRTFYGRPWARLAAQSIAEMCFCYYIHTKATRATETVHWFVGRESNAVSASELAEYVVKSIWSEGHKLARKLGEGNEYARNFAWGAAQSVSVRCALLKKDAEEQRSGTKPGTALVLASVYQIEQAANEKHIEDSGIKLHFGRTRAKDTRKEDAINAGKQYGDKVSLARQVGGSKQKVLS